MPRQKSKTSSFGSSKREGHDATQFYSSNLYSSFKVNDQQEIIDHSFQLKSELFESARSLSLELLKQLPDHSTHLFIVDLTHFPTANLFENENHMKFLTVITEIERILITGGKTIVIVDNIQPKKESAQFYPFHANIIQDMITAKFLMRGEVIWKKNPNSSENHALTQLNSVYFHILIFSKQIFNRIKGINTDTITRDQFLQYTKSIWTFQPELMAQAPSNPEINQTMLDCYNHICQLYTFEDDKICCVYPKELHPTITELKQRRKNIISLLIEKDF